MSLVQKGDLKKSEVCEEYKNLVLEASKKLMPQIHFEIIKFLKAFEKLSAEESVADHFAQDVLKNLLKNVEDEDLKTAINYQIEKHNQQIENQKSIIEKYPELDNFTKKLKEELETKGNL